MRENSLSLVSQAPSHTPLESSPFSPLGWRCPHPVPPPPGVALIRSRDVRREPREKRREGAKERQQARLNETEPREVKRAFIRHRDHACRRKQSRQPP
ncbi:hypothetical protein ACOMHN_022254 [Nucella lapillus]